MLIKTAVPAAPGPSPCTTLARVGGVSLAPYWSLSVEEQFYPLFLLLKSALVLASVTAIGFGAGGAGGLRAVPGAGVHGGLRRGLLVFPQALLDYLGKRSYTLYLVHIPMFFLTLELMHRYARSEGIAITEVLWPQYTVLTLVLVFGATELIHRTVERPMIALGKRIAERSHTAEAATPQPLAPTPMP